MDLVNIIKIIDPMMKLAGFSHRSKRNWYLTNHEVVQNVHLEKSSYSNKNWLECYLTLPRMDGENDPEFGITLYVDELLPDKHLLARALDPDEQYMDIDARVSAIQSSIELYMLPALQILTTDTNRPRR